MASQSISAAAKALEANGEAATKCIARHPLCSSEHLGHITEHAQKKTSPQAHEVIFGDSIVHCRDQMRQGWVPGPLKCHVSKLRGPTNLMACNV